MNSPYRRPDSFAQRAKQTGFPARSVYKLEEIDRRLGLLKPGMQVIDLGAFPGSWSLYAAKRVGPSGYVLGIDQQEYAREGAAVLPQHCEMRCLDARQLRVEDFAETRFDVLLSDMAPATTGQRQLDQYRSFELFMLALQLATGLVRAGGSFVGKIFQGGDFPQAQAAVRQHFSETRVIRPKATRSVSYEVFLAGLKKK